MTSEELIHEVVEKSGGLPQFNPDYAPSLILWTIVSFGILYVLVSRKIVPKISRVMMERERRYEADRSAAQAAHSSIQRYHEEREQIIAASKENAHKILSKVDQEIRTFFEQEQERERLFKEDSQERSYRSIATVKEAFEQDKATQVRDVEAFILDKLGLTELKGEK